MCFFPALKVLRKAGLTRFFGFQLLKAAGWTQGEGLGAARVGGAQPVAVAMEESALSRNGKSGLGFSGGRYNYGQTGRRRRETHHHITTIFDNKKYTDPKPSQWRRRNEDQLSYR
jgi:transcription elongation factor